MIDTRIEKIQDRATEIKKYDSIDTRIVFKEIRHQTNKTDRTPDRQDIKTGQ